MTKVGLLGVAHMHASSYVACLRDHPSARIVGLADRDTARATRASTEWDIPARTSQDLLAESDAVVVCAENMMHAETVEAAAAQKKPVLCEKPIAASEEQADRIQSAVTASGIVFATAFPCPFSPSFERLLARVTAGEIGKFVAVNSTNRGRCPFDWFVQPELSGGGAMVDHTVHVADLLRRLLGETPERVTAQTGHKMYGQTWEDTAHLTLDYPSGVFATIDSSWSRPQNYKTWGDVTLTVVGEKGVVECDLFGQGLLVTKDRQRMHGTASNLDRSMVDDFLAAVATGSEPKSTLSDGLAASRVALAGYRSAAQAKTVKTA